MNNDNDNQSVPIIYDRKSINLPFDENAFKDFIVSLLGQPELIEGNLEGAFEIDFGGIEHLNTLIDSRISKQNVSSLLEFRVKLFFSDDSSMSFNSLQSFLSYKELRPLICEGFILTWSYLVKFNNKPASERQEISISSVKNTASTKAKKGRKAYLIIVDGDFPRMSYSIRCTDKEWGVEIAELLRRGLSGFIRLSDSPGLKLRKRIIDNFRSVELACISLAVLNFSLGLARSLELGTRTCRTLSTQVERITESRISVDEKLDFLIEYIYGCLRVPDFSFLSETLNAFVSSFIAVFLPVIIYYLIQIPNYRFILFTNDSKKKRDEYFRRRNDRRNFWMITILLGLVIGIAGNFIFSWLTSILR